MRFLATRFLIILIGLAATGIMPPVAGTKRTGTLRYRFDSRRRPAAIHPWWRFAKELVKRSLMNHWPPGGDEWNRLLRRSRC